MMIELLKSCGFADSEIEVQLPRVQATLGRFGVTGADIERGKQRLNRYYDLELPGVPEAVGLCIKDLANTVLAREEGKQKIIYGFMAPGFEVLGSALLSKSAEVHVANLSSALQFVIGCIFDKMVPILEAAERKWLKSGKMAHCANVKTLVGVIDLGLIPRPDLLVTSGQLCDTAPKTIDLIQELYGIPTYYYDACQDREFRDYPDDSRLMAMAAKSLRRVALKVQEVVGFEITDGVLQEAIDARGGLSRAMKKIYGLMETGDPLPVSATYDILCHAVGALPRAKSDTGELEAVLNTICEAMQDRVNRGVGSVAKGAPRIISLNPHHMTDPMLEHLLGELGIAMVSSETGFFAPGGGRDPAGEKPKDPYEKLSQALRTSLAQSLSARAAIIVETCRRLKVDGVLGKYHVGCRMGAADAMLTKDAITRQLGIPVLLLEWEGFDPRAYNEEQYRRRLELFRDVLISSRKPK
jgi:benzoyl-CoA reductase/2-hydroxyglutaryl-CoA dehydratase subunit BcrC/BadD/HgdB